MVVFDCKMIRAGLHGILGRLALLPVHAHRNAAHGWVGKAVASWPRHSFHVDRVLMLPASQLLTDKTDGR